MAFADEQNAIYLNGVQGRRPRRPIDWRDLEHQVSNQLQPGPWGYIAGSAGRESTTDANRDALDRVKIVPRMLRDVSERRLARNILGTDFSAPVFLSPIGVQTLAHPDGELASARAAASMGVPFTASTASSHTLEQIAHAAGAAPRWYQLYWPKSRDLAASFIARAEASGYSALVVTLDTWLLAWRPRDLTEAFLPFLWAEGNVNYFSDPVFCSMLDVPPQDDPRAAVELFTSEFSNASVTWDDLRWLRDRTSLPIILKGIQHVDDARCAVDAGMDAVFVSNHGGRQVDGAIGSLDALASIGEAVGSQIELLFDSGVRGGADVVKALSLGASAVGLGRPFVWGLAAGGEAGVRDVVAHLLAEVELTMALSGIADVADLDRSVLDFS
ncbi:lactate 2-monooxygenase [Rhodococcus qingshengii]|uniref:lactate 2-monooxygenase n=1 Tax=Rhodococcus qingshengii TaxID=334542 RepID=UPI0028F32BC8|nr:lactate 2-monooxygenase [Rhodococcus qingshengii]MDT9664921.1 lactate 2-monooxygenase [Rhodococcus qingshengii]